MRFWKKWRKVMIVVLALGLGYTAYSLYVHAGGDYLTVSELKSQVESLYNQRLKVEGKIAPGSIDWDNNQKVMRFVLTDDRERLNIAYQGVVPDNFKPGADLVVEGRYRSDNTFEALSFGSRRSLCNICH